MATWRAGRPKTALGAFVTVTGMSVLCVANWFRSVERKDRASDFPSNDHAGPAATPRYCSHCRTILKASWGGGRTHLAAGRDRRVLQVRATTARSFRYVSR